MMPGWVLSKKGNIRWKISCKLWKNDRYHFCFEGEWTWCFFPGKADTCFSFVLFYFAALAWHVMYGMCFQLNACFVAVYWDLYEFVMSVIFHFILDLMTTEWRPGSGELASQTFKQSNQLPYKIDITYQVFNYLNSKLFHSCSGKIPSSNFIWIEMNLGSTSSVYGNWSHCLI